MPCTRFIVLKLKQLIMPGIIIAFILTLVIFSKDSFMSAKSGIYLWANSLLPSLLPFFIATELLGHTGIIPMLGKLFNRFMRPLFNVPGECVFILIMGTLSGYPIGAKITSQFLEQGIITKEEAERLISFTNNSGPLFILGTVGVSFFSNSTIGYLLLTTHILSSLTVGFLFRWWKSSNVYNNSRYSNKGNQNDLCISNLGEILSKSIMNSINTIVLIGGFITLFSVITSTLEKSMLLNILSNFLNPLLTILSIPLECSTRNYNRFNRANRWIRCNSSRYPL